MRGLSLFQRMPTPGNRCPSEVEDIAQEGLAPLLLAVAMMVVVIIVAVAVIIVAVAIVAAAPVAVRKLGPALQVRRRRGLP